MFPLLLFALFVAAPAPPNPLAAAKGEARCIAVSTHVRIAYPGYDHVVELRSACEKAARCLVATNVDPQPRAVDVAPGADVEVLMRRGSPAREFTAEVSCSFAAAR